MRATAVIAEFDEVKEIFAEITSGAFNPDSLKIACDDLNTDRSYFGQMITDFNNGIEFKRIVLESNNEIDGYRWPEHNDPRGLTYCLFSSSKLSNPKMDTIKI